MDIRERKWIYQQLQVLTRQNSKEDRKKSISSSAKDWRKFPHLGIPSEHSDVLFHALIQVSSLSLSHRTYILYSSTHMLHFFFSSGPSGAQIGELRPTLDS